MTQPKLYSYWRSSASYRVRIALALKGISYDYVAVNLAEGEQAAAAYQEQNPERLVPLFVDSDGTRLSQSLAIIEYLEATRLTPSILPREPARTAQARAFALAIAADIHPLQNLRVLKHIRHEYALDQQGVDHWARHWIEAGFAALETRAAARDTDFLFGDAPGLAECFLLPQAYNAKRFGLALARYPALAAVIEACNADPTFAAAHPANQPDAPQE